MDNRFYVHTASNLPHTQYTSTTGTFTATHGTTSGSPQNLGGWIWGTSGAPNAPANVYWAAWMEWQNALKNSNRMVTYFQNVDIMAFDTNGNLSDCDTSCARGWFRNMTTATGTPAWAHEQTPTVVLDDGTATPYAPQARVNHELGHIADFLSGPNQGLKRSTGYCFNDASCNWSDGSLEYRPAALTEGMATFIASVSFYTEAAQNPRTCFPNGNDTNVGKRHCYPGSGGSTITTWGLETSSWTGAGCGGTNGVPQEGRQPVSAMRFFWDIIDSLNDGQDDINLSMFNIFDSLAAWPCPSYPACYSAGQLHDQFTSVNSTLSSATNSSTELDDGNGWDFRNNMLNNYSGADDVQNAYWNNCMGIF